MTDTRRRLYSGNGDGAEVGGGVLPRRGANADAKRRQIERGEYSVSGYFPTPLLSYFCVLLRLFRTSEVGRREAQMEDAKKRQMPLGGYSASGYSLICSFLFCVICDFLRLLRYFRIPGIGGLDTKATRKRPEVRAFEPSRKRIRAFGGLNRITRINANYRTRKSIHGI